MKKFFFFAFILSLFLLGCPSDGYIDEDGVHWKSYPPSKDNPQSGMYCYNYDSYRDCAPIGYPYNCFNSESACVAEGGTVRTEAWCESNASGGFFYNCDWPSF